MYLRHFRVRNYMIHKDTKLDLLPLTVLVGPNGGGKSALFDAILNFSMLSRGSVRQAFGPYPYSYRATIHRGTGGAARIGFAAELAATKDADDSLFYELDYSQVGKGEDAASFTIYSERLSRLPAKELLFDRANWEDFPLSQDLELENDRSIFAALRHHFVSTGENSGDDLVTYCAQQISRFNKFRLDPSALAQPSRLPESVTQDPGKSAPRLGYRGEDLASTLYFLSETRDPILTTITDRVREVDPSFSTFDFAAVGADRIAFAAVFADKRQSIPSVRLSSGFLTSIGLTVLALSPNRPPVLMIEEPENGLTPQAVKAFYRTIRELAYNPEDTRRSQVLLSSHSPFVICEAWNGDDRNFIYQVKVDDGKAIVRRFADIVAAHGIQLAKEHGERQHLGLSTAEEVMSGYMS